MSTLNQFLDLFTYCFVEQASECKIFKDCVILRSFDNFQAGQRYEAITVGITLRAWRNEYDDEEGYIYY